VFEPESAVVVVIDTVPEVKAVPEVEAEAEVGNDEVGPEPALAFAFVTTKQSIVNSLGRVPSPTTITWRCPKRSHSLPRLGSRRQRSLSE